MTMVHTMRPCLVMLWWLPWLGLGASTSGCRGSTTSLDTEATTTGAIQSTTAATTTGEDESTSGDGRPITCPSACAPLLAPSWDYEGPEGHYTLVEMLRDPDGALWLGTQRSAGTVGLVRLSAQGELEWSVNPGLPCDPCELADIALHPSGDVLLSATGRGSFAPDQLVVARFDVVTREVAWVRTLALAPGDGVDPRAGELAVLGDDRLVVLRVNGFSGDEVIEVLDFTADGSLRKQAPVSIQPGSGGQWNPLATPGPTGEIVLAHMWWDDEIERMVAATTRVVPGYRVLSLLPLPQPLDELLVDDAGRRLELARSRGTQSITLSLTSRSSSDLERWSASLPLLSTSSTRAALAVGPDDAVYVAARTTPAADPGQTFEVTLAVTRWSADGMLEWQSTRPLDMMATPDPLELLIDDDHGVIVGTVIKGRTVVARYEQACACE